MAVHLPRFLIQRPGWPAPLRGMVCRRDPKTDQFVVVAVAPDAQRDGVQVGMTLEAARRRSRCSSTGVTDDADQRTLIELAASLRHLGDRIAALWPDTLLLERDDPHEASEEVRVHTAAHAACQGHPGAVVVVADQRATALLLAKWGQTGRGVIRDPAADAGALAGLPVEALSMGRPTYPLAGYPFGPDQLSKLAGLGVRHLGALAALPREAMLSRFGDRGVMAHQIARGEPVTLSEAQQLVLEQAHTQLRGVMAFLAGAFGVSVPDAGSQRPAVREPDREPDLVEHPLSSNVIQVDFGRRRRHA